MNALKYLPVIATLMLSPMLHAAEVFVSHYEPLHSMTARAADSTSANVSQKPQREALAVLSFEALGKSFDLNLVPNDRLLASLPADAAFEGVYAYRGHLANNPDSWVRIVMFDGMPRGLIWDGETMFAIEAPGDSAVEISSPVIYRLSDLNIAPGTMTCGTTSFSGNAAQAFANMKKELGAAATQGAGAVEEITMGVLTDSLFTNAMGGDAAAAAAVTARFSNIDGWFSEQVGVQINVQRIDTFDNATDPFDGTLDTRTLLDQLSEYRDQTPAQSSLGLTHLYTGRDFTGTTVGIAWRGALCNSYFSAGLSEGRVGVTTDSLIAAHEIGHNFGAEHDGQAGSSCENEPETFIMAPSVSGVEQFSACSITVMQAEAAAASCVVALPAVDVGIRQDNPVATVLLGANTDLNYDVSINGTLPVADVVADFTLPGILTLDSVTASSGTCFTGAGTISCELGDLPGLSNHTIVISTTPSAVGVGAVNASVTTTDTDERMSNNQDALQLTVDPAVDLVVDASVPTRVLVDASTTVTATLENLSVLQATNLSLSVALDVGLRADTASWTIGTCTVTAQQIDCQANSLGAQLSSALSITATAMSTGRQDVTVRLSSAEADANPSNNSASGTVNVVTPNDDGGGGTTNPLFLLVIALASLLGRRGSSHGSRVA
jgi:hypothetical protein